MAAYNAPDPVEGHINQLFDRIVIRVNVRREAVLEEYRELLADIASRPLARARQEQELIAMRTDTENRLRMNELREVQERILAELELKLAEVRTPQPAKRVVLRSECAPLEQLIGELGEVLEEEVPIVPNYHTMRPVVAVGKKGKAPGELFHPHAVATDSTNRIFVAEGSDYFRGVTHARISVFSERGEFLDSFTHQDMSCPWGIAIRGDNLYVTDAGVHAIFLFKIETGFPLLAKQGTIGHQIGEFHTPYNLTVSNTGDVYVADCLNNRVQILNNSLQLLRTLSEQPIEQPRDIKLTPDEVYVLCFSNPYVHVFSHAGERLRSLVSRGPQMQVTNPN